MSPETKIEVLTVRAFSVGFWSSVALKKLTCRGCEVQRRRGYEVWGYRVGRFRVVGLRGSTVGS